MAPYSYAVTTLHHFIRRIAIDYVRHGYTRYCIRHIPEGKDCAVVDQKLIDAYSVTQHRTTRTKRKRAGLANVVFVRYGNTFILLATEGEHPQFGRIVSWDIHTAPIHAHGYSIGIKGGKPCVLVSRHIWKPIADEIMASAKAPRAEVEAKLNRLRFYSFPGVIRQKLKLTRKVNEVRRRSRLPPVQARFTEKIERRMQIKDRHWRATKKSKKR